MSDKWPKCDTFIIYRKAWQIQQMTKVNNFIPTQFLLYSTSIMFTVNLMDQNEKLKLVIWIKNDLLIRTDYQDLYSMWT